MEVYDTLEAAIKEMEAAENALIEEMELLMLTPRPSRKWEKKYLRDNTPEYKRIKKSRKANRELARERRGEQYFTYRDPEHGNLDIVPYYPVQKGYRSRKANERFFQALQDLYILDGNED